MAITPKCDVMDCGRELDALGAIVLSPPDFNGMVRKLHVCVKCYGILESYFGEPLEKNVDTDAVIVDK